METKKKIAVCIPLQDHVCGGFFQSFLALTDFARQDFDLKIFVSGIKPLDTARNSLVSNALENDCDYILFLDTDHSFDYGLLDRFEDLNVPIVTARYALKVPPFKEISNGLGFALINSKVFEAIPSPWFSFRFDEQGRLLCGEDVGFFKECEKAGFEIVYGAEKIRHIGGFGI